MADAVQFKLQCFLARVCLQTTDYRVRGLSTAVAGSWVVLWSAVHAEALAPCPVSSKFSFCLPRSHFLFPPSSQIARESSRVVISASAPASVCIELEVRPPSR